MRNQSTDEGDRVSLVVQRKLRAATVDRVGRLRLSVRMRRVARVLLLLAAGYGVGRLHQRDVVAMCYANTANVRRMLDQYDTLNVRVWEALGWPPPVDGGR